jgi:hypothetical protein
VIDIPLGVLVLFMLFLLLLAGMAYEEYIRPKLVMYWLKKKLRRKPHIHFKARKV